MPQAATAEDRLKAFQGSWRVRRTIIDRLNSANMRFEGEAFITPMQFEEHGDLVSGGTILRSSRTYRFDSSGDELVVRFPDLSEFVRLTPEPTQRLVHHCGADLYRGRVIFRSPDLWAETWVVVGPRKNYRSVALYERVAV